MPLPRSGVLVFAHVPQRDDAVNLPAKTPASGRGTPASSPRSNPLSRPLPLASNLAQVGLEVDLDRVPLGGDVALPHLPFPRSAISPASPPARAASAAAEQVRHPLRLRLGERHDRPERLDEADEVEAGVLGGDDPPVERHPVVGGARRAPRRRRGR